jgi:hypothetical protein
MVQERVVDADSVAARQVLPLPADPSRETLPGSARTEATKAAAEKASDGQWKKCGLKSPPKKRSAIAIVADSSGRTSVCGASMTVSAQYPRNARKSSSRATRRYGFRRFCSPIVPKGSAA